VNLTFTPQAWEDYQWWLEHDRKTLRRINALIRDTIRDPFDGIGKPEPLKHVLAGAWSRRITQEHRLVYVIAADDLVVIQCRYHY
jgi:toxin YoeB